MNTTLSPCHAARTPAAWIPLLASLFLPMLAASPDAPVAATTEPRPYIFFMGADLEVQVAKEACRVRDVSGSSFRVQAEGKEVSIPMDEGPVTLRLQQSPKLTENSAVIAKLKGERAYTPANDPYRKFSREQPGGGGDAVMNLALGHMVMITALTGFETMQPGTPLPGAPGQSALTQSRLAAISAEQQAISNTAMANNTEFNDVGTHARRLQSDLAAELFDAMEVTFEVSSEKPLAKPYVVILTRFHERGSKPGSSRTWIYAQALAPVDRTPRKVRVTQGGFPAGFELEDFKVHLYNHGQELATNVAEKRVPLTRDEAFQYLKIEYLSSHKGATRPPDAALGKLPADFGTRLTGNHAVPALFVRVSKDGLPVEAFLDEPCTRKVEDPSIRSAIMDLRFQPALDQGQTVEGTYRLNLTGVRQ
ncbi:MAG: hypothetical protein WC485_02125 [Opitutaceae bacterium]